MTKEEIELIEKDIENTLKQICKMIASGEIPDEVYDKYLSKTPIGFMNETDLYDFLKGKNNKISDLEDNWNKLKEYIDIKLYNAEYLQKLCGCRIDDEIHMTLDIIKKKMQELEGSEINEKS